MPFFGAVIDHIDVPSNKVLITFDKHILVRLLNAIVAVIVVSRVAAFLKFYIFKVVV